MLIFSDVMGMLRRLAPGHLFCPSLSGRGGRRDTDDSYHAKLWYWLLWPITLPCTGMMFIGWIGAVCLIFALMIAIVPIAWAFQLWVFILRPAISARCGATSP